MKAILNKNNKQQHSKQLSDQVWFSKGLDEAQILTLRKVLCQYAEQSRFTFGVFVQLNRYFTGHFESDVIWRPLAP